MQLCEAFANCYHVFFFFNLRAKGYEDLTLQLLAEEISFVKMHRMLYLGKIRVSRIL